MKRGTVGYALKMFVVLIGPILLISTCVGGK